MKLHKNALINAHFTDYSVFMHTNENAEIQQIKQFPLYNYNENEVF
jgi:muconolactone delta-isomerase